MKILLLTAVFWNILDDKKLSINNGFLELLKKSGYKCKKRSKKLIKDSNDFELIYYVVQKDNKPSIIIIPDTVSRHRPYPIYVYIFAIAIYALNPGMSMREAAKITGSRFKITNFSASTLCRVIKRLEPKICDMAAVFSSIADGQLNSVDDVSIETALSMLNALDDENPTEVKTNDGQEEKTQAEQTVPARLRLRGLFDTAFFNEIIEKIKNNKLTQSNKTRFMEYIRRFWRKYFLLYKKILV